MPLHDYSPREALVLLLTKVRERDPELARHLQSSIDTGKDVSEKEYLPNRKKPRVYRRTVRFTDEEALRIATEGLQAHFVEQPLFITSAAHQFAAAALGDRADPRRVTSSEAQAVASTEGVGIEKQLQAEVKSNSKRKLKSRKQTNRIFDSYLPLKTRLSNRDCTSNASLS